MQQVRHINTLWVPHPSFAPVCCLYTPQNTLPCPALQVAEACEQLRQRGFINYYGLQRFGTGGTPTQA
jgi:hypothetical protein